MNTVTVRTDRLVLRSFTGYDMDAVLRLFSDRRQRPSSMRGLSPAMPVPLCSRRAGS